MEFGLVSFKQINKGTIKVFNTPYIKVLQVLFKKCFPWGYYKPSEKSKQYKALVQFVRI
jgi:hypothetical protein